MAGLAGTLGLAALDTATLALNMGSVLSRYDGAERSVSHGAGWSLVAARNRLPPLLMRHGPVIGALCGAPRGPAMAAGGLDTVLRELCVRFANGQSNLLGDLGGPFALALISPGDGRALFAADRVGIIPLYYWCEGTALAFSTALPALYEVPSCGTEIDAQALYSYLYFHAIPSPLTIYRSIARLEPGTVIEFSQGSISTSTYWKPRYTDETGSAGVSDLKPDFRSAIARSVRDELGLGGQVGCFLSGGTDSSTVAGHLAQLGEGPAQSFSIGFDQEGYDETRFARIAAEHFATEHNEYYVVPKDIVDLVPKLAGYYGAPFGNSSVIPTYYCARMAREQGIDRLLGGDGGDELFGGNERYAKQKVFGLYDGVPGWIKRLLLEPVVAAVPFGNKVLPVRKARRYIEQAKVAMPERMETYNLMNWFSEEGLLEPAFEQTIDRHGPVELLSEVYRGADARTMMNRMLAMDLKFTLADNDVPKVTGMCELAGVEAAFPFLSDEMVELSARVPIDMKVKGLRLRHMFKESLRDFLPIEIINKSKHGFGLPFGIWAAEDPGLRELIGDSLASFKQRGIVKPGFIEKLMVESRGSDAHYVGTLVWVFMILEHWYADVHATRVARAKGP